MKIDFIQLDSVSSTNTWVKENASQLHPAHLTCVTAREQTAGRGRANKQWFSPRDGSLALTCYFVISTFAPYVAHVGQIMALSCAELLQDLGVSPQIKWPNDLLVDRKKIGGILSETISIKDHCGVVVGLGLNIHAPEEMLQSIDQPATSLHLILHKTPSPSSLVDPLMKSFISHLSQLQSEGFTPFHSRFMQLLAYKGERITIRLPDRTLQGICDSITEDGKLKLQYLSGEFINLSTGEVV